MTLALEYRPRRFSELAGQTPSAAVLYQMAHRRTVPSALLFTGVRGCGKTSAARILGAALNCAEPPGPARTWPCGTCPSCKAVINGTSLDVTEIDAASNGSVDQIRDVREQSLYSTAGQYRLFILDEAHSMSVPAFNAILKVLEEPPPQVIWALLTTEPGRILPTVASRCVTFTFSRIPVAVILGRLQLVCSEKGLQAEPDLLAAIAERADGAMRDAMMLLEQVTSVGISDLARWQALLGELDFAPGLFIAAARGDLPGMFARLDEAVSSSGDYGWIAGQLVSCMRDVLVLCSGGSLQRQGKALEERALLARSLSPARAVAAMRVLWDLQTRVRKQELPSGLEAALALVSDALSPAQDYLPRDIAAESASIHQLRAMAGDS